MTTLDKSRIEIVCLDQLSLYGVIGLLKVKYPGYNPLPSGGFNVQLMVVNFSTWDEEDWEQWEEVFSFMLFNYSIDTRLSFLPKISF